jgi:hypothetical protein
MLKRAASAVAGATGVTLVLAGWAASSGHPDPGPADAPSVGPSAVAYALYTHCGIADARIDGHWYLASRPLSDGAGNPPSGWGNPYQRGSMRLLSGGRAEFTDANGHAVRVRSAPGRGQSAAPVLIAAGAGGASNAAAPSAAVLRRPGRPPEPAAAPAGASLRSR